MTLCVFVGVGAAFQPLRRIFPRQQAMGVRGFRGSARITSLVWRLTGSCHEDIGLPSAPLPQMLSPFLCETLTFRWMTLPWTKCLIFLGSAGFPRPGKQGARAEFFAQVSSAWYQVRAWAAEQRRRKELQTKHLDVLAEERLWRLQHAFGFLREGRTC